MCNRVIIIGGGPAGLTAAYELLKQSPAREVVVFEKGTQVGGLSKTIEYKGNRIDIGGHRFFSKSDIVMDWWKEIMPLASSKEGDPAGDRNNALLIKRRVSRIYYKQRFYDYPLTLDGRLLRNIGVFNAIGILFSYLRSRIGAPAAERSLEDFFIKRFGKRLYYLFFKDYTEKVWGRPCSEISPEWGAQRIRQVSISTLFTHFFTGLFSSGKKDIAQKNTETSLIKYFLYPAYGPGQLWEQVEKKVNGLGGYVEKDHDVIRIVHDRYKIQEVHVRDRTTGRVRIEQAAHLISSMPVVDLMNCLDPAPPADLRAIADNLEYRDFMITGVLLKQFGSPHGPKEIKDNWIYINDPNVKVGRIQVFNNWSREMVKDPATYWIGMEYFVDQSESFWNMADEQIKAISFGELIQLGFCSAEDVLDAVVVRVPKAYPGYFGAYHQFPRLREYLDRFSNLFLVGRNGMHKYNNQDHSMLTAMEAVRNIVHDIDTKDNIWSVNIGQEYHETKQPDAGKVILLGNENGKKRLPPLSWRLRRPVEAGER